MKSNSFGPNYDNDILSTICNSVNLPKENIYYLENREDLNGFYYNYNEVFGNEFFEKIQELILNLTKKIKNNDMIEEESDEEDDEEDKDEEESSGISQVHLNVQSLIKTIFYASIFEKKLIYTLPKILSTIINSLKTISLANKEVFSPIDKKLISEILNEICNNIKTSNHLYRERLTHQICMIAFSFWDCCKGEGLSHLIIQLRPQNIKRNKLTRYKKYLKKN